MAIHRPESCVEAWIPSIEHTPEVCLRMLGYPGQWSNLSIEAHLDACMRLICLKGKVIEVLESPVGCKEETLNVYDVRHGNDSRNLERCEYLFTQRDCMRSV